MRLWFSRNSQVPIREQLVTQIVLSILCGDLPPDQRLPSTRELARRFHVHPNTISAGYRQLERERWVEFRHGSGVYVRNKPDVPLSSDLVLDNLIANLFHAARDLGAGLSTVRSRLRQWLELQPPDHFLLIEPDEELRRIVTREMQAAVTLPVRGCSLQECGSPEILEGAIPVVLPSKARMVRQALPAGADLLTLQVSSIPTSLARWLPAPSGALVGVVSRWPNFLKSARTMLIAAGFHPDGLVFRDARQVSWRKGLKQMIAIVCDSVTAAEFPDEPRVILFPILSESSLQQLKQYQDFISSPLGISDGTLPKVSRTRK
jgi:GntR family transcriptional regulator